MINLIPPAARKQMVREYWARVSIVWFFLFGTALIIVAILHIPTYFLIHNQVGIFSEGYAAAAEDNEIFTELKNDIEYANNVAHLLESDNDSTTFSALLREIYNETNNAISVTAIRMNRDKDTLNDIIVNGRALDRASLAAFRDDLEDNAYFETATLPISNLAKDQDISFAITIEAVDLNSDNI